MKRTILERHSTLSAMVNTAIKNGHSISISLSKHGICVFDVMTGNNFDLWASDTTEELDEKERNVLTYLIALDK